MNNSVNSNIYAFDAARVLEKYSGFAEGDANRVIVVVSERALNSTAVDAIRKSVDKIGFGADACAWLSLVGEDAEIGAERGEQVGQNSDGADRLTLGMSTILWREWIRSAWLLRMLQARRWWRRLMVKMLAVMLLIA